MLIGAEKIWVAGALHSDWLLRIGDDGRIREVGPAATLGAADVFLADRLLLPGHVNAHSHAFQRLLRGRTQRAGPKGDNFWTWRQVMYGVAQKLSPDDLYTVAHQLFIEMLLSGVTSVGEFHYLHHQADGTPYDDSLAMSKALAQAAKDSGIRLTILRTIYLHGGFDAPLEAHQKRFADKDIDKALAELKKLEDFCADEADARIDWGFAGHSVRAMRLEELQKVCATFPKRPFHMHVSEQQKEVKECQERFGLTPIALLESEGLLDKRTTLVHATHASFEEVELIKQHGSAVCFCPGTEADLGDGLGPASELFQAGVPISLGTDGQTFSSILQEARRLEMHERLRKQQRNLLADEGQDASAYLHQAATVYGAKALGLACGAFEVGQFADGFSVDLNDPHLCGGADNPLSTWYFSGDSRALRDVFVGGEFVVRDGVHKGYEASRGSYQALSEKLFSS